MLLPKSTVDFDSIADNIVADYLRNKGCLNSLVLKQAVAHELNPNELQRLVELTNIKATLAVLASAKDRTTEFELADYSTILKDYVSENYEAFKKDPSVIDKIPTSKPVISPVTTEDTDEDSYIDDETKIRMANKAKELAKDLFSLFGVKRMLPEKEIDETPKHITIIRIKKEAEKLVQDKIAEELNIYDNYDYFLSEFNKYNSPDFNKFAEDCYALYGKEALPVLNSLSMDIRGIRHGWPKNPEQLNKLASDLQNTKVVDDTNPLLKKFASVMDSFYKIVKIEDRLVACETALSETKKSIENLQ